MLHVMNVLEMIKAVPIEPGLLIESCKEFRAVEHRVPDYLQFYKD